MGRRAAAITGLGSDVCCGEILRAAARRHTAVASACSIDLDQIAERSITAPFIAIEARDVTGI
jgi:hypothetical protein